MIFDADQHLFERPSMWRDYCDPQKRESALTVEPDELGYCWAVSPWDGRRLFYAYLPRTGDGFTCSVAQPLADRRAGIPAKVSYEHDMPEDYWSPSARLKTMDASGIDQAAMIPHVGLMWLQSAGGNLDVVRANLEAWNRWAVEVQQSGGGRLFPVGHVTLRGGDLGWLDGQLRALSAGGVKLAMFSPTLHDGRRLSHPDHERAWSAFVEHGIAPVFHVSDSEMRSSGFDQAWFENDHHQVLASVELPFFDLGLQLSLTDLAFNGVFARHPALQIYVVEFGAAWFLDLGERWDGARDFAKILTGRNLVDLELPASEYLYRQVRVGVSLMGDVSLVGALLDRRGADRIMFGTDFPHSEGVVGGLAGYRDMVGELSESATEALYGGTARTLMAIA